jgi:hypothetical protein
LSCIFFVLPFLVLSCFFCLVMFCLVWSYLVLPCVPSPLRYELIKSAKRSPFFGNRYVIGQFVFCLALSLVLSSPVLSSLASSFFES